LGVRVTGFWAMDARVSQRSSAGGSGGQWPLGAGGGLGPALGDPSSARPGSAWLQLN